MAIQNLTEKENLFIKEFLKSNDCGATTPGELLEDNYSCQTIQDIRELFSNDFSPKQISGILSALEQKGIIWVEERDGRNEPKSLKKAWNFEPDLFWVSETFLEELPADTKFEEL
jgi:hypothetical protein